jgi:hypothetical protein
MGGSSNICCGGGDGMLCGTGGRTKGLVQMFSPKYKKSSCLVGKKKERKLTTTRCCR